MNEFVSCQHLAKRWNLSESKVQRMAATGELPSARFGRVIRIPRQAALEFEKTIMRRGVMAR